MEKQYSYGAVIIMEEKGELFYLLVKNYRGEWGFPKGHKEGNEKPFQTARREIEEETNIAEIEFLPDFKEELIYSFEGEIKKIEKHSTYFLAKTKQKEVKCLDGEHAELKWCTFNEAMSLLTFENTKELLKKAEKYEVKRN